MIGNWYLCFGLGFTKSRSVIMNLPLFRILVSTFVKWEAWGRFVIRGIPAMIPLSAFLPPSPVYPVASRPLSEVPTGTWDLLSEPPSHSMVCSSPTARTKGLRSELLESIPRWGGCWRGKRRNHWTFYYRSCYLQGHKAQIFLQRLCFSLPSPRPPLAAWIMAMPPLHLSSGPPLAYSSPLLTFLRKAFLLSVLKLISSGNAD